MGNKFKFCALYLALFSCSFISRPIYANDEINFKGKIGGQKGEISNMSVNPDGSISFNGKKSETSNGNEKVMNFSGNKKNSNINDENKQEDINNSENKTNKTEEKIETNNSSDIPTDFSGGIGQAFYSSTGVLTFEGNGSKNKKNTKNNKQESVSLPIMERPPENIVLSKTPPKIAQSMPIPKGLPPLPSENGNVMLPISLPTSKAVSLPPLPDFFMPNLGVSMGTTDQGGINNNGIAVDPNGKPINYKGLNSIFQAEKNKSIDKDFIEDMKDAANKFLDLGLPMKIVIVDTEDFGLRHFVATNILRSSSNNFESIDTGLTAILSLNTKFNDKIIPVCYIVMKNDQQKELLEKYVTPLSKYTDLKTIAAYLVAHEVTHCVDNLERYKVLPKTPTWFPETVKNVGLSSDAVRRIYPYGMTYNQYSRTIMHLYDDLAQRQYQQRIADIFGVYLTLFAGYDPKISDAVIQLRKNLKSDSPYNTFDAIKNIKIDYDRSHNDNIKSLWSSARDLQTMKGIDNSLKFGANESVYSAKINKISDDSGKSITEEFKNKPNKDKNTQPVKPKSFNDVEKFGNKPFSGNVFGSNRKTENTY